MFSRSGSLVLGILAVSTAVLADDPKPPAAAKIKVIRVANEVEGMATILSLVPDGSRVKKGDLVCELDSSEFREALLNQDLVVLQATADLDGAAKARESAEIARKEAGEVADEEIEVAEGEVNLAKSAVKLAKGKSEKSEAEVLRAELALKKAEGRLKNLVKFTKPRKIAEADAAIEKAKSDETAKRTILALQQSKAKRLRTKIERCKIVAPADGKVILEHPKSDSGRDLIEEGASVRERQSLFRLLVSE